ncbi:MAG: MFS transporter [Christensenellales bacterium]|jgi:oligogalacturonide transporter
MIDIKEFKKMNAYACGDAYGGGVYMLIASYFMLYLTVVEQISPVWAGTAIMIGKIWDGITDPIMGVIVERTKSRLGKCRPYIAISVFPVFLSFFMLWYSFGLRTEVQKVVYYTFSYVFFSTVYTVFYIPYSCLLPRIVDSYDKRTNYSSMQMIYSGVASVFSTYFYEFIIYRGHRGEAMSPALKGNFAIMGLILGVLFAIPVLITFLGVKEEPCLVKDKSVTLKSVFAQYGSILQNSSFRKHLSMGLAAGFIGSMVTIGMTFFAYIVLKQEPVLGLTVITVVLTIKGATEIGFFPVNVVLMKKFNKHMPYKVGVPVLILACSIALFIPIGGAAWIFIISISFLGIGVSSLAFVSMTLFPDITDVEEAISGKRREGLMAGLSTFIKKVNAGIASFIAGGILSLVGLDSSKPEQAVRTIKTMWGVKIIYSVIPIIAAVILLAITRTFKLDNYSHTLIKKAIGEKREKGYTTLSDKEAQLCAGLCGLAPDKIWLLKNSCQSADNEEILAESGKPE